MHFLLKMSVVNPRRAFKVNGTNPDSLFAGTIATFGVGDDPALSNEDEELLRLCKPFLDIPSPENIARVHKEIEAAESYWRVRMDDGVAGGCSFRGFRAYRKPVGDNARATQ
jgi:hypothetical protein